MGNIRFTTKVAPHTYASSNVNEKEGTKIMVGAIALQILMGILHFLVACFKAIFAFIGMIFSIKPSKPYSRRSYRRR